MNLIYNYNKLNNSFKKKLVFHLGAEAGFYSEFNNMVYAILYCLKHQYQFVLYTKDANFKFEKGWQDFFEPFCTESTNQIHTIINTRVVPPKLPNTKLFRLKHKTYKILNKDTVLTYQLWPNFFCPAFENETFDIPELGIHGRLKEAAQVIVNMIYRPNYMLQNHITKTRKSLKLPEKYAAINVRRGDKNTEFDFVETNTFIEAIKKQTTLKDIFIFTDDFSVIEELKKNQEIANFKLFYLVDEDERGYVHSNFIHLSFKEKKERLLKMFTSVEIMNNAEISFGSYTNNPGFFLGMRMPEGKFVSLQKKQWYQFEMSDVVDVMSDDMKNFLTSVNAKL